METTILYHQKRKPPGTNPAARPCLQTRTRFCRFAFTDTRPIIPHETKEPRCLRGSPENTPQNHSPQRKEDANNYMQLLVRVNEKAAGRLIPDCLQTPTQPPMRLVDTSKCWLRPLQTPKQAQPPQEEVPNTICSCVAYCQRLADRYSSPRCAIFRTLAPSSTSGIPATLVNTDTMAASAAEEHASAQSTPPSAVLAPITATAA